MREKEDKQILEEVKKFLENFEGYSDFKGFKKSYKELLDLKNLNADKDFVKKIDEEINSALSDKTPDSKKPIEVFFGYSWHPWEDVLTDGFWTSFRDILISVRKSVLKRFKDEVSIFISRLRVSHGEYVYKGISDRISSADLLIFDIAETKDLFREENGEYKFKRGILDRRKIIQYNSFNPNVLIELGHALGIGKYPIIMCPDNLKDKIPSDLKGYMWTFYEMKVHKDKRTGASVFFREFIDEIGIENLLRSRLRKIAKSKIS